MITGVLVVMLIVIIILYGVGLGTTKVVFGVVGGITIVGTIVATAWFARQEAAASLFTATVGNVYQQAQDAKNQFVDTARNTAAVYSNAASAARNTFNEVRNAPRQLAAQVQSAAPPIPLAPLQYDMTPN